VSGLVIDASAALKLARDERGRTEVRHELRKHILAGDPILVPPLFWLEIVNVLATRHRYPPEAIVETIYELEQSGITTADVGRPGVLAVIDAVSRFGLSAYDAAYLVLAESADTLLLTADIELASAAGARAILVGKAGGVADVQATYPVHATWPKWRGAAAYLSELRSAL